MNLTRRQMLLSMAAAPTLCAAACGPSIDDPIGTVPFEFSLPDLNPASPSYREAISPSRYRGSVVAWYFSVAT